ncbi:cupin [Pseudomonas sp. HR96]|uniref:cupin n=1 Tax=Pseudomonas sp. HR96 TaxID=1027966 RepID=UPI002A75FAFB|nr:cupin [Pseudomonas sp. HR96]WPO97792.1 cupin [Pseudomonas sp. HR96]
MQEQAFRAQLAAEGFGTTVVVEREAGGSLEQHAHPFEAKALVLHGSLHIRSAEGERWYGVGEVFHLQANQPHCEVFGELGVRYLVGRK